MNREARVQWLRDNPDARRLPPAQVVRLMKLAGVLSYATTTADVNLTALLRDAEQPLVLKLTPRQQRVQWLRENPDVIQGTPHAVLKLMRAARLLSVNTCLKDVGLRGLLRDAGYNGEEVMAFEARYTPRFRYTRYTLKTISNNTENETTMTTKTTKTRVLIRIHSPLAAEIDEMCALSEKYSARQIKERDSEMHKIYDTQGVRAANAFLRSLWPPTKNDLLADCLTRGVRALKAELSK